MSIQHPNPHLSSSECVSGGQKKDYFLVAWVFKKTVKKLQIMCSFSDYKGQYEYFDLQ